MEYKGLTVVRSRNGNIIIRRNDGAEIILSRSNDGILNDDKVRAEVDRYLNYINKDVKNVRV